MKSLKEALKKNAEKVNNWPPYLRTYSSEYFRWKKRINAK